MKQQFHVFGRSHRWFENGLPLRYVGAVSPHADGSKRDEDIVQSLPTKSSAEAVERGRYLRGILEAQRDGYKIAVDGRFLP